MSQYPISPLARTLCGKGNSRRRSCLLFWRDAPGLPPPAGRSVNRVGFRQATSTNVYVFASTISTQVFPLPRFIYPFMYLCSSRTQGRHDRTEPRSLYHKATLNRPHDNLQMLKNECNFNEVTYITQRVCCIVFHSSFGQHPSTLLEFPLDIYCVIIHLSMWVFAVLTEDDHWGVCHVSPDIFRVHPLRSFLVQTPNIGRPSR